MADQKPTSAIASLRHELRSETRWADKYFRAAETLKKENNRLRAQLAKRPNRESSPTARRTPETDIQTTEGVCIVCGSNLLLRIWRGHPGNAKIHCNDCGSEIPLYLHNQRNKI